jgi:hypothetical protein
MECKRERISRCGRYIVLGEELEAGSDGVRIHLGAEAEFDLSIWRYFMASLVFDRHQ